MTAINKLLKELKTANPPLQVAVIAPNHVRQFAEHMRTTMFNPENHSIDFFVKAIEAGEVKIMGVPLRVRK